LIVQQDRLFYFTNNYLTSWQLHGIYEIDVVHNGRGLYIFARRSDPF
jgi:hypothetical protein